MKINLSILAVLCIALLTGCGGPSKKKQYIAMTPKADVKQPGEVVRKQSTQIEMTQAAVWQLGDLIGGLTVENAPQVRQQAMMLLGGVGYEGGAKFNGGIYQNFSDLTKNQKNVDAAVVQIVEHVRVIENENTELKLDDPARRRLDLAGFGCLVLAIGLIVGSFFMPQPFILWVTRMRLAGAVLLIFSGAFYAAAWYLKEIRFVFICFIGATALAGLVVAIVYAIRNHGLLLQNIKKIELGKMTGQVVFNDDAANEQFSVLKGSESDVLAAIVDKVQETVRPKIPTP